MTMDKPLVSVVLVVCNIDRFLAESIESILAQTFREFEFIIVDFGSTDRSLAIISEYAAKDDRIQIHTVPHCGLGEARNIGCSLAQGRYIALMDADDVSVPERLAWEIDFMQKHQDVSVLGGAVQWIDTNGRALMTLDSIRGADMQSALREGRCPLWQSTVLMRRDAFVHVGGYRPIFAPAEDYDLWLRMAEHFQIANLEEVLLKYRIHPYQESVRRRKKQTLGSLAAQLSSASRTRGDGDPLNSLAEITPESLIELGVTEAALQTCLAREYLTWIDFLCRAEEDSAALNSAREMLRSSKWEYANVAATDVRIRAARICWRQNQLFSSAAFVLGAAISRPIVLTRPFRRLLKPFLRYRRLGRAFQQPQV
jgi:hypothetical protein